MLDNGQVQLEQEILSSILKNSELNFQWHLSYFLTRDNAIGKFVDNGEIWMRYKKKYYTLRDEYEEWGINTEDYINSI